MKYYTIIVSIVYEGTIWHASSKLFSWVKLITMEDILLNVVIDEVNNMLVSLTYRLHFLPANRAPLPSYSFFHIVPELDQIKVPLHFKGDCHEIY